MISRLLLDTFRIRGFSLSTSCSQRFLKYLAHIELWNVATKVFNFCFIIKGPQLSKSHAVFRQVVAFNFLNPYCGLLRSAHQAILLRAAEPTTCHRLPLWRREPEVQHSPPLLQDQTGCFGRTYAIWKLFLIYFSGLWFDSAIFFYT